MGAHRAAFADLGSPLPAVPPKMYPNKQTVQVVPDVHAWHPLGQALIVFGAGAAGASMYHPSIEVVQSGSRGPVHCLHLYTPEASLVSKHFKQRPVPLSGYLPTAQPVGAQKGAALVSAPFP